MVRRLLDRIGLLVAGARTAWGDGLARRRQQRHERARREALLICNGGRR